LDSAAAVDALRAAYAAHVAQSGAHSDEMLSQDSAVRPVWAGFAEHLAGLSPDRLTARFARGDQYLRDAGVLYRQYNETLSSEREWPLSHIAVLMDEGDWAEISAGLIERAELLDYVLRDFYGDNTLVASGQLPGTLLSRNPAWLRPMVGAAPVDTPLLNSASFEIGRGPDGKWWVISDLIEAPSTAGFAIENRIATSRVFPNFFRQSNIHRLAGFFRAFQDTLFALKGQDEGEIALLSPGPLNEGYAEHAYLARYLGLLLVEGDDLIVHNGKVHVRTVAGMRPVSLIWSRLPSAMLDPLELTPDSMLGTPGLVQAVRDGALRTVNMVGAGVLETRALMAFLPTIARARLGHDLALSNIATWWCGQEAQRDYVLANQDKMMVGNAFSTRPLMADPATINLGDAENGTVVALLTERLRRAGDTLVGQEAVTLSTTPVFENGGLVPRPMCIRISLGRTPDGWSVMPGGYARISAGSDAKALAMQQVGKVADVWIASPEPVATPSLLSQSPKARETARAPLPSRAADNLFWLGRYVERTEHNMRLFRAYFARKADSAATEDALRNLILTRLMHDVVPEANAMAQRFSEPLALGLNTASRISDRFSPDGMMALRGLVQSTRMLEREALPPEDVATAVSGLLRQITGFAGLVHENMYRHDGWRFMSVGISLERAANMCELLAVCLHRRAPDGALDLALEVGDSIVSHRARFLLWSNPKSVADLLGLDPENPRSIRYHIARAKDHIDHLPQSGYRHRLSEVAQQILLLDTHMRILQPSQMTPDSLKTLQRDIWDISDALTATYLA